MKAIKLSAVSVALFLIGMFLMFTSGKNSSGISETNNIPDERPGNVNSERKSENKETKEINPKKLWKKEFNEKIYFPYSYPPPMEVLNRLQNDADNMPQEETDAAVLPWRNIGPFGFQIRGGGSAFHSGRARDYDYSPVTQRAIVAVGTGGLFRYQGVFPVSIGDNLPLCNINSVAGHPADTNIIFAGTGEEGLGFGKGLLRSTNSGGSWDVIPMAPGNEYPSFIFKVRYNPQNYQVLYAATTLGFQRSTNGGSSWTVQLPGVITDFAWNPVNLNIIYAVISSGTSGAGFYISRDGGSSFNEVGTGTLPPDNTWGNVKLAISAADTSRLFITIAKPDGSTQGTYRSLNSGNSWSGNLNPDLSFHWGNQGLRNNAIGISQINADYVFIGAGPMKKSTNGGLNWVDETSVHGHADATRFVTFADGKIYWLHDGGISVSVTNGSTWTTALLNNLPTIEFYHIAAPMNEKFIIAGGTQDNATPIYDNTGFWYNGNGGDGAGVVIDPVNTNRMIVFDWNHNGYAMHRHKTNDYFASNNEEFNNGIPPNSYWWGLLRHDFNGTFFFTNSGPYIYYTNNSMSTWTQLNGTAFPHEVIHFQSTANISGSVSIYAALNNPSPNNSSKLRVYDGTGWYERNDGLPANRNIGSIGILKSNKNVAIAVVNGINSPGQKIFKTGNAGLNWANITGDLADLPINTVIIDQDVPSIVYIGTEGFGIYRTVNNGINWTAWNYGLPRSARVRELSFIDSAGSSFTVVAGTYGRSVYLRDAEDDDPVGISGNNNIVKEYSLSQNYPNPFNPATKIKFSLAGAETVNITVYDVTGKMITELVNNRYAAGTHEITFDGSKFSSGVYFYRITTSRFTDVKKMILVK